MLKTVPSDLGSSRSLFMRLVFPPPEGLEITKMFIFCLSDSPLILFFYFKDLSNNPELDEFDLFYKVLEY